MNLGIPFDRLDIEDVIYRNTDVDVILLDYDTLRGGCYRLSSQASQRLGEGSLKSGVGKRLVKVVHRVEVESVERVSQIGCREYEAGAFG